MRERFVPRYASPMADAQRSAVKAPHDAPSDPAAVLARWPRDRLVACLQIGSGSSTLARWSLIGEPCRPATLMPADVRGPDSTGEVAAEDPTSADATSNFEADATALRTVKAWIAAHLGAAPLEDTIEPEPGHPPFSSGRVAVLAYELGAILEPAARDPRRRHTRLGDGPLAFSAELRDAHAFDHLDRRWWSLGERAARTEADATPPGADPSGAEAPWSLSMLEPDRGDAAFEAAVRRCVELIHAGDLFQASLAERFTAVLDGSPRSLAARALGSGARFGGYVELSPDLAILSMSPELFLAVGEGGAITTCPIKGTRPTGSDLAAFARSSKEAAELAMIVDLMRNDLGRVCRPGSIEVVEPRRFESHPTVVHGVAEIRGRLREGIDLATLLAAAFPPGSVTGAPKIRAMQVIDELEPTPRGPYCGSLGWIDDRHGPTLNVAIRTAVLRRDRLAPSERWLVEYHAGCGIVADSDQAEESLERRDKTAVLARWASR